MHDYLLSSEWVRFAFVFGVTVSMVLYEKRHLTTGSIVVPGYIAVFIIHPPVLIATFANALFTYWLVNHVLRRFFLLYGRTKFTILAVISTLVQTAMLRATPRGEWLWESDIPLFIGVGYVVPALIAHDMARQGVVKTCRSVMLAGALVASPIAIALVLDLPGVNELAPLDGFGDLAIPGRWLPLAVVLSVMASWGVAYNYGLRSGGFVGAAFLSMFMGDPWQVVMAAGIAVLTYLVVSRLLMNQMILFGRRKFSAMLLVSSFFGWTTLWLGARVLGEEWQEHLGLGSLALTPLLLPGLLANDAQRTSPRRVLQGVLLGGSFVLTTTWWVQSAVTGATLHPGWKLVSIGTAAALFNPQVRVLANTLGRWFVPGMNRPATETVPVPVPAPVPAAAAARVAPTAATTAARIPAEFADPADLRPPIERIVPTPAVLTPAPKPVLSAWAATGSPKVTPWSVWSEAHPDDARAAEDWLDGQLEAPAPAFAAAGAPTSSGFVDDLTAGVLETALATARGVPRVPRSRRAALYSRRRRRTEISGTSDGVREAHPTPSAVPEHT